MSTWWDGLPAAEIRVECGGEQHRVRWEAGELLALDHEDADAERTLAALGGQRCACVDVLDAWARHAGDLRVLVLASRGPGDVLAREDWPAFGGTPASRGGGMGWTGYAPRTVLQAMHRMHVDPQPDDDLIALLGLGGGLPDRLAATVAAAWAQRLEQNDEAVAGAFPQLHAALYGRATAALQTWLREAVELDLHVAGPGGEPSLSRSDGRIRAELPFAWLVEVWARDLSVVFGRFCLAATREGSRWTLTTVGPELGETRPITVDLLPG
jgi:hypothetical protein